MRKTTAPRPRVPTPRECIFEASEIGMLLEPDDDVLQPSAIGMVLLPESMVRPLVDDHAPPGLAQDHAAPEPRTSWYPPPKSARRWDLVETVESEPPADAAAAFVFAAAPVPRRKTPRKNPYRAPESQWDARIDEVKPQPRRRLAMWTAISAGVSAVVCCVAFLIAVPAQTAPAESEAIEPTVIGFDADLIDEPQSEIAVAAIADDTIVDRRSHALALALRGRTNMAAGRSKLALSQFHEALEYNAQNRLALAQLGEWHLARGRAGKASEYLRRAVRVEPRDGKAHLLLGRAYEELGRPEKAAFHLAAARKHGHADER